MTVERSLCQKAESLFSFTSFARPAGSDLRHGSENVEGFGGDHAHATNRKRHPLRLNWIIV